MSTFSGLHTEKTMKLMEMRCVNMTKKHEFHEKRNTTQNPQTSKMQCRHVQLPTRRVDLPIKKGYLP